MSTLRILPRKPTGIELLDLRRSVGWPDRDAGDIQKGLDGSLFAVCACLRGELAGSARVVGDGWPNDREGAGMIQFWKQERNGTQGNDQNG